MEKPKKKKGEFAIGWCRYCQVWITHRLTEIEKIKSVECANCHNLSPQKTWERFNKRREGFESKMRNQFLSQKDEVS